MRLNEMARRRFEEVLASQPFDDGIAGAKALIRLANTVLR